MEEINITVGGTSNTRKYRVTPMKFKELKTKLLTEFANAINKEFHDECVVNVRENDGTVNVFITLTKPFFDRYNASLKKGQKSVTLTEGVIRFEMSKDEIHFELNTCSAPIREMIVNSVTSVKETFVPQWEELLNSYEVVEHPYDEDDVDEDKHENETEEVNDLAKIKAIRKASFINKCEGKIADAFGISEKSVSILESEEGLDLYIMIGEDFVDGYNKLVLPREKVKSEDILSNIDGIIGKDFDEVFDTGWIDEDDRNIIKFVNYIKAIYENVCVPLGEEWQEKFGDEDEEDDDDED